ncbi:subtilisin-like protease SBT4.3, partial [Tanacetum coccineum]
MGFPRRIDCRCAAESDVIMGIFDTGIWPESERPITIKRKVIGARSYSINGKSFSARDIQGHGMHVASIATGNKVKHPSYFDLAQGTARGGVPSACIAAYKVCEYSCNEADILIALDDTIADGVDMITIAVALDSQHEPNSDVVHLV